MFPKNGKEKRLKDLFRRLNSQNSKQNSQINAELERFEEKILTQNMGKDDCIQIVGEHDDPTLYTVDLFGEQLDMLYDRDSGNIYLSCN